MMNTESSKMMGMMMPSGMMSSMMTGTKMEQCAKMCMDTCAMISKTMMCCMTTMKGDKQLMEMLNMLTDCKEVGTKYVKR